ncbi:MAG TPA: hypothetical protein VE402_00105, partial [Candidatus Angelobacter sp.]|nr:hypothetical protein [Candidatus Angelobacter sp.]
MRRVTFRATLDELWKRAEEIRALCGLPPIARTGIPHDSAEALIEVLLHDLEANFRRELATRVQIQGLGDLIAFAVPARDPDRTFRTMVQYLARALNEPRLWLGLKRGNPLEFSLWSAAAGEIAESRSVRVTLRDMDPEWVRWLALGEGEPVLTTDPWGDAGGGPWHPI